MSRVSMDEIIMCDNPRMCEAEWGPFSLDREELEEANARNAGWLIDGDHALCPSCRPAAPEVPGE